ncbi:uncharacterized protein PV09_08173 [Verruconis gallopava]|uniref:Repressor of RNA polymerase III transcription MAF1 n=1 Tax=Verruconis gallopava TaxID=253628 RepID=A0A0D2A0U1_9PEZI|nr:uncharacterized protein PV09_08173 [Verruconis gallopava]KIW00283.1 hypothetical protein PV09_08173 [Verruconis gallopava]
MKYIPLPKFDLIDAALNFHRDGLDIEGSCDIFTIKMTKADKKLKRKIDDQIEHEHQQTLQMAASLSPPDAARFAKSANLTQASTFGNLIQPSNRRTYAYLIGTLNASHPDYDLSNVLRPQDFCRERDVQDAINEIDAKVLGQDKYYWQTGVVSSKSRTQWGYDKWLMIDEEMDLRDCEVYNFCPAENPFDGDGIPIWSLHYFFFNRAKKRVCYLQVRAIDPSYNQYYDDDDEADYGVYQMDSEEEDTATESESTNSKRARSNTDLGASKRARYWLGDRYLGRSSTSEDERPQVDLDQIRALVEYRRKHPEEFPEILDEEEEDTTDRTTSASPTPASSGEDSDAPGGKKTPKSPFKKAMKGSDARAMSADLSGSFDP